MKQTKSISLSNELVRFLITGLVCAAADFLVTSIFLMLLKTAPRPIQSAISLLAGFVVGVFLNYLLSTYWVFKGRQKDNVTKSVKFIVLFIIFSAVAYGLSYGTYELCRILFETYSQADINSIGIDYLLKFTFWGNFVFWLFVLAFFLKTLVGLIWNYFTRKYILYKNNERDKFV